MNKKIKETESCFTCAHYDLCFLRVGLSRLINGTNDMLNIDADIRPLTQSHLYVALGNCCTEFKNKDKSQ